jgi:hypothetical protein
MSVVTPKPEAGPAAGTGRAAAPDKPEVRRQARILLPVAVSVLVAFAVVTGYLMVREPAGADKLGRWAGTPSAAAVPVQPSEDMAGAPNPFRTVPSELSGPPTRLRVPAIGVDTSLETLKLGADGELQPPRTNERAGW